MKPKNFPGRKLARVKGAAARFPANTLNAERATVVRRASVDPDHARAIRTKKNRSGTAHLR